MIPSDEAIRKAATRFKTALDAIDRIHWDRLHINNYPRGSCGHSAELLARYLTEQFGITPEYVCRDFHDDAEDWLTGHAWLEWNGLLTIYPAINSTGRPSSSRAPHHITAPPAGTICAT